MKKEDATFPVDGQFLMVLPRAGASVKNPVQLPILRSDTDGYYLEMRVDTDLKDKSEVAVTRRVPLENQALLNEGMNQFGTGTSQNLR